MTKTYSIAFILVLFTACSGSKKEEAQQLTEAQKFVINEYAEQLIQSINAYDFSVINKSWNYKAFKSRVSTASKTQASVFDHIFEKDLKRTIKVGNVSIIYEVNDGNGSASVLSLKHFTGFSELTLLLSFSDRFDFIKYRIELINKKPSLTDFYHFKDDLWYSEKIVNLLRLSSKFDSYSKERHQANRALNASQEAIRTGDLQAGLYALYDIPETHQVGNWLSLKKLNLAITLGDSIYADVLTNEYKNNKSLYLHYLHTLYFNRTNIDSVYEELAIKLGNESALDSLFTGDKIWN